jgi:hypothetical protein
MTKLVRLTSMYTEESVREVVTAITERLAVLDKEDTTEAKVAARRLREFRHTLDRAVPPNADELTRRTRHNPPELENH